MSNNNFSRHRRGIRFKPKGGLNPAQQKPDREAVEARAAVVSEQRGADRLFEKRHTHETDRAKNIAAGLPPEGKVETPAVENAVPVGPVEISAAPVAEEKFEPGKIDRKSRS